MFRYLVNVPGTTQVPGTLFAHAASLYRPPAVDRQDGVAGSVLSHYRQMLGFRKAHPALVDGDIHFLATNQELLAFTRTKGEDTFLFVFNLTREKAEFVPAKSLKLGEPLPVPGFGAKLKDGTIELDALDMACVRL